MSAGININLTEADLALLKQKGIDESGIFQQIEKLTKGFPSSQLIAACTIKNGLQSIDKELDNLSLDYEKKATQYKIVKFVPASGAASRMFKHLYDYLDSGDSSSSPIKEFLDAITEFPFTKQLELSIKQNGGDFNTLIKNNNFQSIIYQLLSEEGLNFGKLPKALIPFHKNDEDKEERTPLDEHLEEGAIYAKGDDNLVNLHFTVSTEHLTRIEEYINSKKSKYEKKYNVKYNISYSRQEPGTDTIALGPDQQPIREKDGTLLFRPSGHGALLKNLQKLDADLIFIKNIDNVVPSYMHVEAFKYKQAMGAMLLNLKTEIDKILKKLQQKTTSKQENIEIINFAKTRLSLRVSKSETQENIGNYLFNLLNRPIRICGMVKNQGAPGGGPFWVKDLQGEVSLQIVESSQIDLSNPSQLDIFKKSTHFNPVDIVCSIKDFNGNKFNLQEYRDDSTGLISEKSKNGSTFKALELPGLWNGSMANWISIFVEIPLETFNPVKTINDLLKPMHK